MQIRKPGAFGVHASLSFALLAAQPIAAQDLSVVFRDKPPYSYVEGGVQKGFLLDRTRQILEAAGIRHTLREMPPKRIFQEIQDNAEAICSFGWYKIPEREKFARFSLPIHTDRPHVVLAGPRSAEDVRRHKTLKALMADGALTLATVDGVSYGPDLDAMIAGFAGKNDRALIPPVQVAKKVAAKRADFMLIDQEDYDYLLATNPEFRDEKLVRIEYPDLPPGLKRYILCSHRVGTDTMAKIDAAIERLPKRR
jgi:uncharacterized protein (TIGR02285 family)